MQPNCPSTVSRSLMGARGATASRYFPKIKPAKINLSLFGKLLIHVAVDVGGDLGGDVVAAQLVQCGLDGGGQRGLALGIDGGAAEGGNLDDICGCGLDMHAAADQARANLGQVKIVQVILAGAD